MLCLRSHLPCQPPIPIGGTHVPADFNRLCAFAALTIARPFGHAPLGAEQLHRWRMRGGRPFQHAGPRWDPLLRFPPLPLHRRPLYAAVLSSRCRSSEGRVADLHRRPRHQFRGCARDRRTQLVSHVALYQGTIQRRDERAALRLQLSAVCLGHASGRWTFWRCSGRLRPSIFTRAMPCSARKP